MEPAKKAVRATFEPLTSQASAAAEGVTKAIVPDMPVPPPPPPPLTGATKAPDTAVAADRARVAREMADSLAKKRGRRSTVLTGNEGVGATPLGFKTLVGS